MHDRPFIVIWEVTRACQLACAHCRADAVLSMALSPSVTPKLTRDVLVDLRRAGARAVSLSLDGATAETHDCFRRVAGVFDAGLWSVFFLVPTGPLRQHLRSKTVRLLGSLTGEKRSRSPLDVNAGRGFSFIDHVGSVYPSGFLPVEAGSAKDGLFSDPLAEDPSCAYQPPG